MCLNNNNNPYWNTAARLNYDKPYTQYTFEIKTTSGIENCPVRIE